MAILRALIIVELPLLLPLLKESKKVLKNLK
jgi:hypothetical protein